MSAPTIERLDESLVTDSLCRATLEVFGTMLSMDAVAGQRFTEKAPQHPSHGLVALIGMAGSWVGTGAITCSAELACKLSSHFLLAEFASVNDEVLDAMGELTNMIIGNFKNEMETHLGSLGLSIPTVIFGRNFVARSAAENDWIALPFECGGEVMTVKVCLAPRPKRQMPRGHAPYAVD
ncbi:MAG: chemotaxis protein CheX [Bryobacteraceae bacterium]|jgi:chemotaxis protein CheX